MSSKLAVEGLHWKLSFKCLTLMRIRKHEKFLSPNNLTKFLSDPQNLMNSKDSEFLLRPLERVLMTIQAFDSSNTRGSEEMNRRLKINHKLKTKIRSNLIW